MKRLYVRTEAEIRAALPAVLEHLEADGLLAYPTETVYGFGGAVTAAATAALRSLKSRETVKPFLLLIAEPDQAPGVRWTSASRAIARLYWPGPLTLALPAGVGTYPEGIVSQEGLVALRASPHPLVQAVVGAWGGAITSTSANAPGTEPGADTEAVLAALTALDAHDVLVLDGGRLPESAPSTILAVEDHTARVLRAGAVSPEDLRNQLSGIGIDVR
ncbi:MAG TPA: L-threonylcarbamoyladenylate synthase [Longimicrobiales bacterium]|nr:L-threonylcarbamoyladenylate synthase [Longimicrobiales bacterium]